MKHSLNKEEGIANIERTPAQLAYVLS